MAAKLIIVEKKSIETQIKNLVHFDADYFSLAGNSAVVSFKPQYAKLSWLKSLPYIKQLCLNELISLPYGENLKKLKTLILKNQYSEIILATDPDNFGQYIAKQVYDYVPFNNYTRWYIESFSKNCLTQSYEQRDAFKIENAIPAQLKTHVDYKIGYIFSRLVSLTIKQKSSFWKVYTVGRVQSPLLKLVYDKEETIKNFKPEELSHIYAGKFLTPWTVQPQQVHLDINARTAKVRPPKNGLNTDALLTLCAKESCFKNKESIAVHLNSMYHNGYISYPRVENDNYGNFPEYLEIFKTHYENFFSKTAEVPTYKKSTQPDHQPITPLVLPSATMSIYDKTVLRILYDWGHKIFSGCNKYTEISCTLSADALEPFNIKWLKKDDIRYTDGVTYYDEEPPLKLESKTINFTTQPPARYSFISLIKKMGALKLGTKSSRSDILQKLISSQYLKTVGNKYYITPYGKILLKLLSQYLPQYISASFTANLEQDALNCSSYAEFKKINSDYALKIYNSCESFLKTLNV